MKAVRWCALCVGLVGCEESQYDYTPPPRGQNASPLTAESDTRSKVPERQSAVAEMTAARCDREVRCKNVGQGQKYASREACLVSVGQEWRSELSFFDCPGHIVESALEDCLDELRANDCQNPLDSLERVLDCDSHEICSIPHANPRP
jgi:hypothetical protein